MKFLNYKDIGLNIFKLLGSGILTTFGFVILASGKITTINSDISLFILLFIQFETIGLTIAKFGMDNLIYAKYISNADYKVNPIDYIKKQGIYLAIIVTIVSVFIYDIQTSIFLILLLFFDLYTTLSVVQITARGKYSAGLLINFVSYPLFFLLLFGLSFFLNLSKDQILMLLTLCLGLRFVLSYYYFNKINQANVTIDVNYRIGLQQLLNYILFKSDQIIFSFGLVATYLFSYNNSDLKKFIFLSKLPEVTSGVLISLAVLYAPILYIDSKEKYLDLLKKYKFIFILGVFLAIIVSFLYTLFWVDKGEISLFLVLPYLVQICLIVIVNMITVGYLKDNKIDLLNKNLLVSISFGIIFGLFVIFFKIKTGILWITSIQLIIFSLLPLYKKR